MSQPAADVLIGTFMHTIDNPAGSNGKEQDTQLRVDLKAPRGAMLYQTFLGGVKKDIAYLHAHYLSNTGLSANVEQGVYEQTSSNLENDSY